jgi:AmmeMemoRadiSam system protein B
MADPVARDAVRRAVCAGSWYPGRPDALRDAVEEYLAAGHPIDVRIRGVVSPHAGFVYSGRVAGHAYAAVSRQRYDVIVLVGPSHHYAFEGVASWPRGAFATPLGELRIEESLFARLHELTPLVRESPAVHEREHCLELQLPFLARLFPETPILPLVMGRQTRHTVMVVADALANALQDRHPLLVASSDLSHYQDRATASRLDAMVVRHVEANDADGLQHRLEADPSHACGGGPMVAVLRAARALGATGARVLKYADSGDVTGDTAQVVGYMSAALGDFVDDLPRRTA